MFFAFYSVPHGRSADDLHAADPHLPDLSTWRPEIADRILSTTGSA